MKFVSICSVKDTLSTLPPAAVRKILEATTAWVNQKKQAGKLLEIYGIAGWRRSLVIYEAESAEEIVQTVTENPLGAFLDHEVYALADFNEVMKLNIESVKRAEQLFPGTSK